MKPVGQDQDNFYFETENATRAVPRSEFSPETAARLDAFTSPTVAPQNQPLVIEPIAPGSPDAMPSPTPTTPVAEQPLVVEPVGPVQGAMSPPSADASLRMMAPQQQPQVDAGKYPEPPKVAASSPELQGGMQVTPGQEAILQAGGTATGGIAGAYNQAKKAEQVKANAAKTQADAEVGLAVEKTKKVDELNQQIQAKQEERLKQEKAIVDEYSKFNNEIQKPAEIDPKRFWNNKTGWEKAQATFAVLLGGFAGGKGENKALTVINNQIQQDIDAQKQNIANLGAYEDRKSRGFVNKYDMALKYFGNEQAADLFTKASYIDHVQGQLDQFMSKYKSSTALANGQAAQAKLEAEKQNAILEAKKVMFDEFNKAAQVQATQMKAQQEMNVQNRERYVPGLGLAATKEDATKLKEKGADLYDSLDSLNELKKIGNQGFASLSPEARAKADSLMNILSGKMRTALTGGGPLTEDERAMIKGTIGNPTKFFSLKGIENAKLDQLVRILNLSRQRTAQAYGIDQYQPKTFVANK